MIRRVSLTYYTNTLKWFYWLLPTKCGSIRENTLESHFVTVTVAVSAGLEIKHKIFKVTGNGDSNFEIAWKFKLFLTIVMAILKLNWELITMLFKS